MGILSYLGFGKRGGAIPLGIASPWSEGDLSTIILSDLIGAEALSRMPLSRDEAMSIPAVAKARNLLVSTIAGKPLVALDAAGKLKTQPSWMSRSDSNVTPYERMAWTVDDIMFYGYSLWSRTNGAAGALLDCSWVPTSTWGINHEGKIHIDNVVQQAEDVILFNSPFEGLLNIGTRTLRGAIDIEASWVGRARNPIPLIEIHLTDDSEAGTKELEATVKAFAKARTNVNGAIGATPKGVELRVHGEAKADLMVEGRNAIRTDVGSLLNIRASMLDGTAGVDSLTYTTTAGEKNSFYEVDLPFWVDPIAHRLSMDDVVPHGTRTRFDFYDAYSATPNPTGIPTED